MKIVLVGAWWTGMSGVAGILHDLWYTDIHCIDAVQSELTEKLRSQGLDVIIGHGKYKVQLWDAVIYSEAVAECEEVQEARKIMKANKKAMVILNYFQFLGEVSKYFKSIGFAGTNGKSSSTALAIHTVKDVMPDFWLGILWAMVPGFNNQSYAINKEAKNDIRTIFDYIFTGKTFSSLVSGSSSLIKKRSFLVEACEYKRHFLHLDLDYAIITSLELDHTDYYQDMEDYLSAYETLISKVRYKVFIPQWLSTEVSSFNQFLESSVSIQRVRIETIEFTHLIGDHNTINGSLVLALMKEILANQSATKILTHIKSFWWIWRRLEFLQTNEHGAKIFTDYGHMASSIDLGYQALKKKFPDKKLFVIFQPHQINRIITGRKDFQHTLKKYDKVIIYDIYAARENIHDFIDHHAFIKEEHITTLEDLGNHFAKECWGIYTKDFTMITKEIENTDSDSIVVIYSAGDIDFKIRKHIGK